VCAWCLRWSLTHWITDPWIAIDPSTANACSTHGRAWNDRCVSIRWKPTVIPRPVNTYNTANNPKSVQPTTLFHNRTIAAKNASSGMITAARLTLRWARLMAT
jgi:hypothetical protein